MPDRWLHVGDCGCAYVFLFPGWGAPRRYEIFSCVRVVACFYRVVAYISCNVGWGSRWVCPLIKTRGRPRNQRNVSNEEAWAHEKFIKAFSLSILTNGFEVTFPRPPSLRHGKYRKDVKKKAFTYRPTRGSPADTNYIPTTK